MKRIISALVFLILTFGLCSPTAFAQSAFSSKKETALSESSDTAENAPQDTADYMEGVVNSSELFYINGVVFWGYGNHLCSALIDDDGNLYDFVSEGRLSSDVSYVASDGEAIYMATDAGLICLSFEQSREDTSYLSVLDDHSLNDGFQLFDGQIFFRYGYTLYSVPCSGGESRKLEKDIRNFQVTTQGIYCLNKDGDLLLLSLDGRERRTLYELDSEGDLGIFGDKAYITTGEDDDYIFIYDLARDSCEKLELDEDISPYYAVWVEGDDLYYRSEEGDIRSKDLSTGKESLCDTSASLPDYDQGFLLDGFVYYEISDTLYWEELDGDFSRSIDSKDALGSSSGSYNIGEGITVANSQGQARLESVHFTLYLPADGDWAYELFGENCVNIFYAPSQEAGVGGSLVSIMAYDLDDNSYEVFPHYTVAGVSSEKRYIAVFPTDVQYSPETEKGYREMLDYVLRIDVDNKDNPFSCR